MHDSTKDLLENHPSGAMCPKQYQPSLLSMHKLRQSKSKSVKNRPASSNRWPVTSVGDKRHLRAEESGQFFAFDQFNYAWYKLREVWQNSIFFQLD